MNMKRLKQISKRLDDASNSEKELSCEVTVDIESSARYFLGDEEITEERWLALSEKRKYQPTVCIIEIEGEQDDF